MNKNSIVLLKALLKSTSQWNIYKNCKDKKKKGRIVGNFIGFSILYLCIIAYCIAMSVGYGKLGLAGILPAICALTVSALAFIFTLFKTNGYLFNFKEYDMLMSLPFTPGTVAGCKFMYMYIKSLPWNVSISVAMLIGYAVYYSPEIWVYPLWLVLSLFLPVIPMLAAAFIGFLIAKVSAGLRKKNIIQTILTFIFVLAIFALRFGIEAFAKDEEKINDALLSGSEAIKNAESIYLPAKWFDGAVTGFSVSDILLLTGVSILLFAVIFIPVGRSYRSINSKLKSHAASKKFKMSAQKSRSIANSIAYKEFKRMTGSATYMVNGGLGELFSLLIGIAALIFDIESIIAKVLQDAPVSKEMLYPAFPLIIYFMIGMVATTAITPSLEGKNYWIVKSLPIPEKTLYRGKMLFNMYLTVPFALFGVICLCISAKVPVLTSLLEIILMVALCAFSTAWGCVCGIKHMRLDWENEIEVIKQGSAVAIYMFPNMFATMALVVLVVILGMHMNLNLILLVLILIVSLLACLCYKKVMKLSK
ncbi:MAG: hypothetical protein J6X68_03650 [Lachnospiraceae bacterium]|nr:hypothetical protein [Lachnospiraceae bacterium]